MLKKSLAIIFVNLLSSVVLAEPRIDSGKAAFHVGETVMLCGTISEVTDFKNGTYINFGAKYPRQHITAVIWNDQKAEFSERFGSLRVFENQRACARGEITEYKNMLQLKIKNPQFLRLMK